MPATASRVQIRISIETASDTARKGQVMGPWACICKGQDKPLSPGSGQRSALPDSCAMPGNPRKLEQRA